VYRQASTSRQEECVIHWGVRNVFGSKREEGERNCSKLHNENFHIFQFLLAKYYSAVQM
jgi:hypothetical protein